MGNTNIVLSLSATDWSPTNVFTVIELSWNSDSKILAPNEVIQSTLTVTVAKTVDKNITDFGFNVIITGTATA